MSIYFQRSPYRTRKHRVSKMKLINEQNSWYKEKNTRNKQINGEHRSSCEL